MVDLKTSFIDAAGWNPVLLQYTQPIQYTQATDVVGGCHSVTDNDAKYC